MTGEPVLWKRFKSYYFNDYFYLSTYGFDAVIYKPLLNIVFYGFGILPHYNKSDCKYIIQWAIDGEKSDEYKLERKDAEKDESDKCYRVNIMEDFGVRPFKVSEGT